MSAFLTDLQVKLVDDLAMSGRGVWMVVNDFDYYSDILGFKITIEAGFLTDFASVPRAPLIYWFYGDRAHLAAVIHDWLFHHHEVCSEPVANAIFREALITQRIDPGIIENLFLGVVMFGHSSWERDGKGNGHTLVDGCIV
jgi:hypothetical protein